MSQEANALHAARRYASSESELVYWLKWRGVIRESNVAAASLTAFKSSLAAGVFVVPRPVCAINELIFLCASSLTLFIGDG